MDEQTFRRLSADAVAGRLDTATFERWKAAAGEHPARATFVVRVAEADAKLSGQYGGVSTRTVSAPPRRVPRRTFITLAVVFAVAGLTAGGLMMHSYLKTRDRNANQPGNELLAGPPGNAPANDAPPKNQPARNTPANNQPTPEPEPDPEPEPQPEPPVETTGLRLVEAAGTVSVRAGDDQWHKLAPGEAVPVGATVSKQGAARFRSASVEIYSAGEMQFELVGDSIRFIEGRVAVRISAAQEFKCYKQDWRLTQGSFIVEPRRLGGELYLLEGAAGVGATEIAAPCRLALDGTGYNCALTPAEFRPLELELIGPHRRLLEWDCESEATSPEFGAIIEPGALGDGHAAQREPGRPGIGVAASREVFKAVPGARLRMRVKCNAANLRIEFRVRLDSGFRVVDAKVDLRGNDNWQTIDLPLDILRAGRFRNEPGWHEGRVYSAFLLAPAVDPGNPLARHELLLDDLIVYVPE